MKLVSKPISSPSRLDKFPPPLMRFLRNNGGSRSRGRSRSSPIFIRRRNEPNTDNTQEEPSSPKVTCMGQVRVTRSKKKSSTKNTSSSNKKIPCFPIPKALFCDHPCRRQPAKLRLCPSFWGRWCCVPFGIRSRRKSSERRRDIKREETGEYVETGKYEETEETEEEEEDEREKVFVSCSPPKNALMLMRCKSEPPRVSSLAYKFWGSPPSATVAAESQEQKTHPKKQEEEEEEEEGGGGGEVPMSRKEPICRDSAAESRIDPENKENVVYTERLLESSKSAETGEEGKTGTEFAEQVLRREVARPVILPRSKSEPARRRPPENVDSETWFWKRRLNIFEMPNTTRF